MLKPAFEKGSVLKQNMLEALRDYPYTAYELIYAEYGDGIISGFEISIPGDEKIEIDPGILKHNGKIFFCAEKQSVEQRNGRNYVYLEVTEERHPNGLAFSVIAKQYDDNQPEKTELFRYTKNAKLFAFKNVRELVCQPINRINKIYSQHSVKGGNSLCPEYFSLYADEILNSSNTKMEDYAFAYQCFNGVQSLDMVRKYFGNDGSNEYVVEAMKKKIALLNRKEETIQVKASRPQGSKGVVVS